VIGSTHITDIKTNIVKDYEKNNNLTFLFAYCHIGFCKTDFLTGSLCKSTAVYARQTVENGKAARERNIARAGCRSNLPIIFRTKNKRIAKNVKKNFVSPNIIYKFADELALGS